MHGVCHASVGRVQLRGSGEETDIVLFRIVRKTREIKESEEIIMGDMVKSYKGFNKDMTCRGFKYEEGKEYEEPSVEICDHGFHACEYPLDCLEYYAPNKSVYHEAEQSGEIQKQSDDSKVASTKIKIGAEISIAGLVKAAIEYTTERTKKESDNDDQSGASSATGDYGASSATGDYGASSATGYKGASSATGDYGASSATGY